MKTIEQKAEEYFFRFSKTHSHRLMSQKELTDAYEQGAKEALAGQWRKPEELEVYECDSFVAEIIVRYRSKYKGRWLTITSVNAVSEWTDDYELIHKGDELIAWMPIPEL